MATAGAQVREASSPTVKQFSVFLLNKVGALLEIIRVLNESQVHVIGLNSQDSTDSALVRIIVSDPEAVPPSPKPPKLEQFIPSLVPLSAMTIMTHPEFVRPIIVRGIELSQKRT